MQSEGAVTIFAPADAVQALKVDLNNASIDYYVMQRRSFDGLSTLAAIAINAGSHAAKKLVDRLSVFIVDLFQQKDEDVSADTLSPPNELVDLEIRRGNMVLILKNAPMAEVKRIIALQEQNAPEL